MSYSLIAMAAMGLGSTLGFGGCWGGDKEVGEEGESGSVGRCAVGEAGEEGSVSLVSMTSLCSLMISFSFRTCASVTGSSEVLHQLKREKSTTKFHQI